MNWLNRVSGSIYANSSIPWYMPNSACKPSNIWTIKWETATLGCKKRIRYKTQPNCVWKLLMLSFHSLSLRSMRYNSTYERKCCSEWRPPAAEWALGDVCAAKQLAQQRQQVTNRAWWVRIAGQWLSSSKSTTFTILLVKTLCERLQRRWRSRSCNSSFS